jgi:hypothetical protein
MVSLASLLRVVVRSSFLFSNINLTKAYPSSTSLLNGSKWPLFLFSKKATVPPSAITDPFLFSIIFPNYFNSLFRTIFHTILSSN